MTQLEVSDLKDRAVLWAAGELPDIYGQPRAQDPIEIPVRWVAQSREMQDPAGNTIMVDVTAVVSQAVAVGSTMWHGRLSRLDELEVNDVLRVAAFSEVPDLKGRNLRRTLGLARYKSYPPSVE